MPNPALIKMLTPTEVELISLKEKIMQFVNANSEHNEDVVMRLKRIKSEIDINQKQKYQAPIREQKKISQGLGEFDYKKSRAWKEIVDHNWESLSKGELLLIARVLSTYLHIPIGRESKRRKPVLVKWFDENLSKISEYLNVITIQ